MTLKLKDQRDFPRAGERALVLPDGGQKSQFDWKIVEVMSDPMILDDKGVQNIEAFGNYMGRLVNVIVSDKYFHLTSCLIRIPPNEEMMRKFAKDGFRLAVEATKRMK